MAAQGAWFKDVSGWEGPDWFAGAGVVPDEPTLTWGRPDFWEHWAGEHRAVREGVGLFDMSFMAKFAVTGPDAGALLDRLSANSVDGDPGRITYTQWLNEHGRIEADVTVTKRADGDFLVVASDTAHRHVLTWLRRHAGDARVSIADVTSGLAQITVQGPRSRELLASVTSADLSDGAFPFRAAREIDLGFALGLCTRITYVGELGYELFVPAEMAVAAYDEIVAAGAAVRPAALRAQVPGQPEAGEGVPRLRPRHRQHRRPDRGRAGLRGRVGEARRLPRPGRPGGAARCTRRPTAGAAPRPGPAR